MNPLKMLLSETQPNISAILDLLIEKKLTKSKIELTLITTLAFLMADTIIQSEVGDAEKYIHSTVDLLEAIIKFVVLDEREKATN
jgi:hypothetical protein